MFSRKQKEKVKKLVKKKVKRKVTIIVAHVILVIVLIIAIGSLVTFFFYQTGLIANWLFETDDIEERHPMDCECGCIWVTSNKQSVNVDTSTITEGSEGGSVDNSSGVYTKNYLGKAEMSWYSERDNDDGKGNFGTQATSSGIPAKVGITAAIGYRDNHPATKTRGFLEYNEPASAKGELAILNNIWAEKANAEFGANIKTSSPFYWVYIEELGELRLIHDKCGVGSRIDVYTTDADGDNEADDPKIRALNISKVKVYYVCEAKDKDLTPPQLTQSSVNVPGYGASTGSITDTSNSGTVTTTSGSGGIEGTSTDGSVGSTGDRVNVDIPEPKNEQQRMLLERLLPGAVVASEYYNVHIRLTLGLAVSEGGWGPITAADPEAYNGYHIFSISKAGPFRSEMSTSGRWAKHLDFNDAIMHYAVNYYTTNQHNTDFPGLENEGYDAIIAGYSQGVEYQTERHAMSGFNNYKEAGASTKEEYINAAKNYANKILAVTENMPTINDINVAKAYMQKYGLWDEYQKALDTVKKYEEYYNNGYANSTPNNGGGASFSSGDTTGASEDTTIGDNNSGYWLCGCDRPCDKCSCHDKETDDERFTDSEVDGLGDGGSGSNEGDGGSGGYVNSDTSATTAVRQKVVAEAQKMVDQGVMYSWGGNTPESGLDCSGLVRWCYQQAGVTGISRVSRDQFKDCVEITREELKPGDLIFGSRERKKSKITHVMIYIGNGEMIHAPQTGRPVTRTTVDSYSKIVAYGRYIRD